MSQVQLITEVLLRIQACALWVSLKFNNHYLLVSCSCSAAELISWSKAICQLYNSVIFEGATLVYRPDCNAEGGCHANSARAKRGRYWLWQPPEALQEGRYTSVAPEQNDAISIISTPEGRAVSVTRELDLSLLCRIWLFGRHLVSLAKIAEVWPPFFLATETPDIALEYTSREIWSE